MPKTLNFKPKKKIYISRNTYIYQGQSEAYAPLQALVLQLLQLRRNAWLETALSTGEMFCDAVFLKKV